MCVSTCDKPPQCQATGAFGDVCGRGVEITGSPCTWPGWLGPSSEGSWPAPFHRDVARLPSRELGGPRAQGQAVGAGGAW